jgi:hypothetical protein
MCVCVCARACVRTYVCVCVCARARARTCVCDKWIMVVPDSLSAFAEDFSDLCVCVSPKTLFLLAPVCVFYDKIWVYIDYVSWDVLRQKLR